MTALPIRDPRFPHQHELSPAAPMDESGSHLALIFRHAIAIALAVFILFEEWGWEPLSRLVGMLARLPLWAKLERSIAALSPHAALAVFLVPWVLLLPLKLLTLWLLTTGQLALAITAVVGSKLVGTAIVARLFTLTKPSLMRMAWFETLYAKWSLMKASLLLQARATKTWMRINRLRRKLQFLMLHA